MVARLKLWWGRLKNLPFGKNIFSMVISYLIPYTGSVRPRVVDVAHGSAKVLIKDCKKNRNHLRCLHALALANVGELSTGLALHFSLNNQARAILVNLNTQYLRKARGEITARAKLEENSVKNGENVVLSYLFDKEEKLVAKVAATWLVDGN